MTVRQLMSRDVSTCDPHMSVADAAGRMWSHDCGVLPVVDAGGHVVGVVTDRDLCIAVATRDRPAARIGVGEVASGHLYAVGPEDDLERAVDVMKAHQVRRLPVVDQSGRLQGLLSLNDIVLAADGRGAPSAAMILDALKAICAHRHVTAE